MAGSPCDWLGNRSSQSMQWSAQDPVRFMTASQTRSFWVFLFTQSHGGLTLSILSSHSFHCYTWYVMRGSKNTLFLESKRLVNTLCLFRSHTGTWSCVVPWQGCLICIWHTAAQSSAHLRSGSYSIHHINQAPVVVDLNEKMLGSPKRWLIVTDLADPNETL